jgi:hypothetical protein
MEINLNVDPVELVERAFKTARKYGVDAGVGYGKSTIEQINGRIHIKLRGSNDDVMATFEIVPMVSLDRWPRNEVSQVLWRINDQRSASNDLDNDDKHCNPGKLIDGPIQSMPDRDAINRLLDEAAEEDKEVCDG